MGEDRPSLLRLLGSKNNPTCSVHFRPSLPVVMMGHEGEAWLQVSSQGFLQQHRIHCTKPTGFRHQDDIQLLQDSLGAQQAPSGLWTVFQVCIGATGTGKAANLVVAWATFWLKSSLSLSQRKILKGSCKNAGIVSSKHGPSKSRRMTILQSHNAKHNHHTAMQVLA